MEQEEWTMNQSASIYQDMATRTGSSIYIGVVGPVRTLIRRT